MMDLLTNTFPLNGKIKLSVTGGSDNGRKNGFHKPGNQFPLAGIRLFFKNWISTSRKKPPNKSVLLQVERKWVSTFFFIYLFIYFIFCWLIKNSYNEVTNKYQLKKNENDEIT